MTWTTGEANWDQAVAWLSEADGLVITAGAGMGVDSGLPDFRGQQGLWRAYPALRQARLDFTEIANPEAFRRWPTLAWGFYGHRLMLYRDTVPHAGFAILRRWAERKAHGAFVYTSNVDGQFQKAGFPAERVMECHGSLHWLQCVEPCATTLTPADDWTPDVEPSSCRLISPLPRCGHCGSLVRPNVLMFNDDGWVPDRTRGQRARLDRWLADVSRPVVIELGAGTAVPAVRWFGTGLSVPVIRINLRESKIEARHGVGLPGRAAEVLAALDARLAALPPAN